jgi:perosamine synthetase
LTSTTFSQHIDFIKNLYINKSAVPLHEPCFWGNEKEYIINCIDSTFVSSIGEYVEKFENQICNFTDAKHSVAIVNGTSALHLALELVGVKPKSEVITQALTFIGTCNAINYCGAKPIFIDISPKTMGMSAESLEKFLDKNTISQNGECINKITGAKISAILPMHTFGHPVEIDAIVNISQSYNIPVVEDAAEALGSKYKNRHVGTMGNIGILSFNGNKIITTGGGGMIITDDAEIAKSAKHLSTTAKISHDYHFNHDAVGYNYRLPNINAALGCAQLENIEIYLERHRELSKIYKNHFKETSIKYFEEPIESESNYWLNTILLRNEKERDQFLQEANASKIMLRPPWTLMNELEMYKDCASDSLENTYLLSKLMINLPSTCLRDH